MRLLLIFVTISPEMSKPETDHATFANFVTTSPEMSKPETDHATFAHFCHHLSRNEQTGNGPCDFC
jgi:hypothetical protein